LSPPAIRGVPTTTVSPTSMVKLVSITAAPGLPVPWKRDASYDPRAEHPGSRRCSSLPHIWPICRVVAPCDPGAALWELCNASRFQGTRRPVVGNCWPKSGTGNPSSTRPAEGGPFQGPSFQKRVSKTLLRMVLQRCSRRQPAGSEIDLPAEGQAQRLSPPLYRMTSTGN
jgi:hypothetical protein